MVLDARVEVVGTAAVRGRMQAVEDDDFVVGRDELVDDVRADESGSAGDEYCASDRLAWKSQREAGAAVGVDDGEIAVVRFDEAFGDRQTRGLIRSRRAGAVGSERDVEDVRQIGFGYAATGVAYFDVDVFGFEVVDAGLDDRRFRRSVCVGSRSRADCAARAAPRARTPSARAAARSRGPRA